MRRLLLLTDRFVLVQAVRAAVQRVSGLDLVAVAPVRTSARATVRAAGPHVVLLDGAGAGDFTLPRIREVVTVAPHAKCVVLAAAMDESTLKPKFDAGADAAISVKVDDGTLGRLLADIVEDRVMQRPRWDSTHAGPPGQGPLTTREVEILRLVTEGYTNAGIARALTVTEQTVKFHLRNIYRKLGVFNRTGASRYAYAYRLVEQPPDPRRSAGL
jgi:DNA-binding NarL/FixJ family response regulator